MKYITFTIPCYNSENYMRRCVDSLLVGGEDVEILIIDDGSSDRTGAIADEYEMLYPNIVKAVHKPKRRSWFRCEQRAGAGAWTLL